MLPKMFPQDIDILVILTIFIAPKMYILFLKRKIRRVKGKAYSTISLNGLHNGLKTQIHLAPAVSGCGTTNAIHTKCIGYLRSQN